MTKESDSTETAALERGTKVRLKQTTIGESLGIKPYALRGGEAVVSGSSIDSQGRVVYQVTILKNGRCRTVYRDDLVVHLKSNQKHYRKKQ